MTATARAPLAAPAAESPRQHGRLRRTARGAGPPLAVLAAVVGVWYAVTYLALAPRRRFLLPPPHEVVTDGFGDWTTFHETLRGLGATAKVALVGLAIAAALGMIFAVLMSQAGWVERSFYPWAVALQTIPILAIVPLIGFWLGYGFWSRTVVCVLVALFPIITNTLFGLQSTDAQQHDLFTLRQAGRWARLVHLEFPSALPAVFTGLRISAGLSVIGAIVGDFFFRQGQPGIGSLIDDYTQRLQSAPLFAAIMVSSLFGLALFWLFGLAARIAVGAWDTPRRRS
ncbi:ABC-type nitrate/sulfonate/bicarbonate transport system, permease component [Frankia torreyi]|uniref:ABC-type nitrate/sulfonate/bicarbonate transport system, permease component n=2 Tax=Frankia TaxID=1854 RepID=A0A0D8B6C1_9ACTN|nr:MULTISPECIES: ABC transporter permease [Frankia]KJE19479.1 ABC-type nitrate/sulfonate/bicarbonate transport system, permease component [Frankia torreyi]